MDLRAVNYGLSHVDHVYEGHESPIPSLCPCIIWSELACLRDQYTSLNSTRCPKLGAEAHLLM